MNTFIRGLKCLVPYFWCSCSPAAGDAFESVTGGQWTLSPPVDAEQLVTASREHRLFEEKKPPRAQGARAGFCHRFSLFLLLSLETANMGARTLRWLGSLGSPSVRLAGWNCSEHCFNQQGLLCLDRSQFGLNSGHGGAFPSLATHSLVQASYALVWLLSPRPPAGTWLGGMLLEILDVRQVGSYAGQQAAARDI